MRILFRRYELVILAGILAAGMLLNFIQTWTDVRSTPPGTVFPLVHGYAEDYYYYLHIMRQGFDGQFFATSKLTPEIFPPVFVVPFFIILGHAARILHMSLPFVYTLARMFGGSTLLVLCIYLLHRVFPGSGLYRIAGLLLLQFSGYVWGWDYGRPTVDPAVHFWTELDPMTRFSYIPHHLFAKVFMLASFVCMLKSSDSVRSAFWIVCTGISVFVMGFASPVALETFVPVVLVWITMETAQYGIRIFRTKWFTACLCAVVVSVLVALYHRSVQNSVFPWTTYAWWESAEYPLTIGKVLSVFGLLFPLWVLGIGRLWKQGRAGRLCIAWGVSAFIGVFVIARLFPLYNIYFLGGYQFIPLAIGAVYGICFLTSRMKTPMRIFAAAGIVVLLCAYSVPSFVASMDEHRAYLRKDLLYPLVYVPRDIFLAVHYLNGVSGPQDVIITRRVIAPLIPAFTSARSVAGHRLITVEDAEKTKEIEEFFAYTNSSEMIKMIDKYRISYIIVERFNAIPPAFLTDINASSAFENATVIVYRIKKYI